MDIINIRNLDYSYHSPNGETKALNNINLTVKDGEFISIIGPSGCGKSTLLSLLSGLAKPQTGQLNVATNDIGYMLQKDHLFEWRTVWENCLIGLEIKKKVSEDNCRYVEELLKEYGLYSFKDKRPSELSGGMRQRVALIRTLSLKPSLLLLDEPFSALDYQTRLSVSDDIGTIIKERKTTAILVTHDISEAISMTDRCVVLSRLPGTVLIDLPLSFNRNLSPLERREAEEFQHYFHELWRCIS